MILHTCQLQKSASPTATSFTCCQFELSSQNESCSSRGECLLRKDKNICPIRNLFLYLPQHGSYLCPLFVFQVDKVLTQHLFNIAIDSLLTEQQIDKTLYNTTASKQQQHFCHTSKHLTCSHANARLVESEACKHYVNTTPQELGQLSKQLAAGSSPHLSLNTYTTAFPHSNTKIMNL